MNVKVKVNVRRTISTLGIAAILSMTAITAASVASAQTIVVGALPAELGATLTTADCRHPGLSLSWSTPLAHDPGWIGFDARWAPELQSWDAERQAAVLADPLVAGRTFLYEALWWEETAGQRLLLALWSTRSEDGAALRVLEHRAARYPVELVGAWRSALLAWIETSFDADDAGALREVVIYTEFTGDPSVLELYNAFLQPAGTDSCLAQSDCGGCCNRWEAKQHRHCDHLAKLAGASAGLTCGIMGSPLLGAGCGTIVAVGTSLACSNVVERGAEQCHFGCHARAIFMKMWGFPTGP